MENRPIQAPGRPWGTIVSLLTALIYGASPIDIIPDLIPLLGWTDDVAVVATLVTYAGVAYLRWKRGQAAPRRAPHAPKGTESHIIETTIAK